jgi:glutamate-1-semialdehyde aminotransferase
MQALTPEVFDRLAAVGERIRGELRRICDGVPIQVTGAGSLFKLTATDRAIRNYRDAVTTDREWEDVASLELLNRGFLMTTQLQGCVSAVTTPEEIDALLAALADIVRMS